MELTSVQEAMCDRHGSPNHMRGWEVFGTTDADDPEVRPLGTVTFVRGEVVIRERQDAEEWPPSEVHGGASGVRVQAYADHPPGAFVMAYGPDRDAVERLWRRTCAAWAAAAAAVWGPG